MMEIDEQGQDVSRGGRSGWVTAAVVALCVLPILFLVLRHTRTARAASGSVGMNGQSAPAAPADLGAMEAAARANPTPANRLNLSMAYINAGKPGLAKGVLEPLVVQDAKNAAAWNNLCVAQVQLMELKGAGEACHRALAIDPNFQLAKNNLAWDEHVTQGEIEALQKLETTAPGSRDRAFYLAQGLHLLHLGEYDAAVQSWQKMLVMDTRDAMAANNIGMALMLKGQPQAAIGWFEKAVSWDPTMQIAKNNLAWAQGAIKS